MSFTKDTSCEDMEEATNLWPEKQDIVNDFCEIKNAFCEMEKDFNNNIENRKKLASDALDLIYYLTNFYVGINLSDEEFRDVLMDKFDGNLDPDLIKQLGIEV